MMTAPIHDILQRIWGYKTFRPLQEDIINAVLHQRDVLAVLPTSGGKSICFQLPVLAQPGLCVVVSPLIALMKDQVQRLTDLDIYAAALYSGMTAREIDITLDNCINGPYKFLYVSPERLQNELFLIRLQSMKVNLIAVDEAHCISQWGYDFRPTYLRIAELREQLPGVPLIALTATATQQVKDDIIDKLRMNNAAVFESSVARANLSYAALHEEDKPKRIAQLAGNVPGSALVYVSKRRHAEELCKALVAQGLSAGYYHAGLDSTRRETARQAWMDNKMRIMVCTNAFGMGIDKPDVRMVIHADMVAAPESYFQEAGRAGRDEARAYAILLYNDNDLAKLKDTVKEQFPPIETIRAIYGSICQYLHIAYASGESEIFDFNLDAFIKQHTYALMETYAAIRLLENAGYITATDNIYRPARIKILLGKEQLDRFETENPSYVDLIKALLRSSPGVLDNYVTVYEYALAKVLHGTKFQITDQLNRLHQKGVLEYIEASDTPQIVFNFPRPMNDEVYIDKQTYTMRRQLALTRSQWMQDYVTNTTICRQILLRRYFGNNTSVGADPSVSPDALETHETPCGICDVCRGRYNEFMPKDEYKQIQHTLLHVLQQHAPVSVTNIEQYVHTLDRTKWQYVLKKMIDEREVILNADFTLRHA